VRAQQGINTLIASGVAVMVAERMDTVLAAKGSRDMFVMIATAGGAVVLSVALEIARQASLKLATRAGFDLTGALGKGPT
jgi:hypothetical protein